MRCASWEMGMKMSCLTGTSLLCFLCCSSPAFAQQPTTAPATGQLQTFPAPSTNAPDRHLVLDVVVTDKSGKAVKGLEQKDFTALDNGHPQTILSFQASGSEGATTSVQSAEPLQIILLVDEVNTNFRRVAYERDE